jgi:hypothetical protein
MAHCAAPRSRRLLRPDCLNQRRFFAAVTEYFAAAVPSSAELTRSSLIIFMATAVD